MSDMFESLFWLMIGYWHPVLIVLAVLVLGWALFSRFRNLKLWKEEQISSEQMQSVRKTTNRVFYGIFLLIALEAAYWSAHLSPKSHDAITLVVIILWMACVASVLYVSSMRGKRHAIRDWTRFMRGPITVFVVLFVVSTLVFRSLSTPEELPAVEAEATPDEEYTVINDMPEETPRPNDAAPPEQQAAVQQTPSIPSTPQQAPQQEEPSQRPAAAQSDKPAKYPPAASPDTTPKSRAHKPAVQSTGKPGKGISWEDAHRRAQGGGTLASCVAACGTDNLNCQINCASRHNP